MKYTINGLPVNEVLTPIVTGMYNQTPVEIESHIRRFYDEVWFSETTPSLRGRDNKLNHRIRSIRTKHGITL